MSAGQKFLFDDAFEAPLSNGQPKEAPPPPPEPEVEEPQISEADLEQARAEGRQEGLAQGREEGRAEAFDGIEQTTQTLLLNLTGRMAELLGEQPRMRVAVAEDALKAASTILRKIAPSLEKSAALKEIEAVVSDCLERAHDEPRLVVRVSAAMLETVKSRIDSLARAEGFEGKVVFLATDDFGDSDVRVEWADGGAERRTEDIWRDIDEVLARFLRVPAESLSQQVAAFGSSQAQPPAPDAKQEAVPAPTETNSAPDGQETETPPPLVSPIEQMGLAAADGSATTEQEPASLADQSPVQPPVTGDIPQTSLNPAETAAASGPQEPHHD